MIYVYMLVDNPRCMYKALPSDSIVYTVRSIHLLPYTDCSYTKDENIYSRCNYRQLNGTKQKHESN